MSVTPPADKLQSFRNLNIIICNNSLDLLGACTSHWNGLPTGCLLISCPVPIGGYRPLIRTTDYRVCEKYELFF